MSTPTNLGPLARSPFLSKRERTVGSIAHSKDPVHQVNVALHGSLMEQIRLAANPWLFKGTEHILRQCDNASIQRALDATLTLRTRAFLRGIAQPFTSDLPPGNHWDAEQQRCARCDSRYCTRYCHAGEPGWVYATGHGWVTLQRAQGILADWRARGIAHGPHHPTHRVEVLCLDDCCIGKYPAR